MTKRRNPVTEQDVYEALNSIVNTLEITTETLKKGLLEIKERREAFEEVFEKAFEESNEESISDRHKQLGEAIKVANEVLESKTNNNQDDFDKEHDEIMARLDQMGVQSDRRLAELEEMDKELKAILE